MRLSLDSFYTQKIDMCCAIQTSHGNVVEARTTARAKKMGMRVQFASAPPTTYTDITDDGPVNTTLVDVSTVNWDSLIATK